MQTERAEREISLEINGEEVRRTVEPRLLLSDFLRHEVGLTGTHVGCEHGVCGACTVLMDGQAVRSCLVFAVQAHRRSLMTVEGLEAPQGRELHPLQEAFRQTHALQCGFCTPGILMTLIPFLQENPRPTREEIREVLSGNLCRCTGYVKIVEAVEEYASSACGKLANGDSARADVVRGESASGDAAQGQRSASAAQAANGDKIEEGDSDRPGGGA